MLDLESDHGMNNNQMRTNQNNVVYATLIFRRVHIVVILGVLQISSRWLSGTSGSYIVGGSTTCPTTGPVRTRTAPNGLKGDLCCLIRVLSR